MNTQEETTITHGTQLSRIYKTDPFGFPLYPYDEEQYQQNKQEQGVNPDAISPNNKSDSDDNEHSKVFESLLNM
jgi:L-rhamnose isomerase